MKACRSKRKRKKRDNNTKVKKSTGTGEIRSILSDGEKNTKYIPGFPSVCTNTC